VLFPSRPLRSSRATLLGERQQLDRADLARVLAISAKTAETQKRLNHAV
jgi:hypothetical protein